MNFYTRDLLWLTLVVALGCGLALQWRATLELARNLEDETRKVSELEGEAKFERETLAHLEKMLNKSVPGWSKKVMEQWEPPESWGPAKNP